MTNRCAIYARYSSELQSSSSIDDQVALCRAFAERRGWTIVEVFADAALSGFGVEQRDGYSRLVGEATKAGCRFHTIVVEDLSRLSRDLGELLRLYTRLRIRGVAIVGVSDGIATSATGAKIHLAVKGLVNDLYLEDLRAKTHRGLEARARDGLSTGGRVFGYRTVALTESERRPGTAKDAAPARYEIDAGEAAVVLRIFREYAEGRGLRAIAHRLNAEGLPYPGKGTGKAPSRLGWSLATVHWVLRNERYLGTVTWNVRQWFKDPDSGRRRWVLRPKTEWQKREYPELRIVPEELWNAVRDRISRRGSRSHLDGTARAATSRHLLSGLLRCGPCGSRMIVDQFSRRKAGRVYRAAWYRCAWNKNKGPAVCPHGTNYRADLLEAALLGELRRAMSPSMIAALCDSVNDRVAAAWKSEGESVSAISAELGDLDAQARYLVRFLSTGGDSEAVRAELSGLEVRIAEQRVRLDTATRMSDRRPPEVHPSWVASQMRALEDLIASDVPRAKANILKHLEEDLRIFPKPSPARERRAKILVKARAGGLLEETTLLACDGEVAGGRYSTSRLTVPEVWIDVVVPAPGRRGCGRA